MMRNPVSDPLGRKKMMNVPTVLLMGIKV
ncbi:MAG: hypothetical protein ACI8RP_001954 [Urechidicola sp.]